MKKLLLVFLMVASATITFAENAISILEKYVDPKTGKVHARVSYSAENDGYVSMYLGTLSWGYLQRDSIAIPSGTDTINVVMTSTIPLQPGVKYNICADLYTKENGKLTNDCQEFLAPDKSIKILEKSINPATGNVEAKVSFVSWEDGYVSMYLGTLSWGYLKRDSIPVFAGIDTLAVEIKSTVALEAGKTYNVCADLFTLGNVKLTNDCQEVKAPENFIRILKYWVDPVIRKVRAQVQYLSFDTGYVSNYLGTLSWGHLQRDTNYIKRGTGILDIVISNDTVPKPGMSYNLCSDLYTIDHKKLTNDCQVVESPQASAIILRKEVNPSNGKVEVKVKYTAWEPGYVSMYLGTLSWGYLKRDSIPIPTGIDTLDVVIESTVPLEPGKTYNLCADLYNLQNVKVNNDCQELNAPSPGIKILSKSIDIATGKVAAKVEYLTYEAGYVSMYLGTSSWAELKRDSIPVAAGKGNLDVVVTSKSALETDKMYNLCADLYTMANVKLNSDCQEIKTIIKILSKEVSPEGNVKVKVEFTAFEDGYVSVFLGTASWGFINRDSVLINSGADTIDVSIIPSVALEAGKTYNVCADLYTLSKVKRTNDCQEFIAPSIKIIEKDITTTGKVKVKVEFFSYQDGYVSLFLGTASWGFLKRDSVFIKKGAGTVTYTLTPPSPLEKGKIYNVCADLYSDTKIKIVNDCQEVSLATFVSNQPVSAFTIYPNPASHIIHLRMDNNDEITEVSVFNIVGASVYKSKGNISQLDISGLKKGLYFVRVTTVNGDRLEQKLIIE